MLTRFYPKAPRWLRRAFTAAARLCGYCVTFTRDTVDEIVDGWACPRVVGPTRVTLSRLAR